MGNRANINVKGAGSSVFLYTHGDGERLPYILRDALKKKERWDDSQYLASGIFREMIKDDVIEDDMDQFTGFGISSKCFDGSENVIVVDADNQTVSWDNKACKFLQFTVFSNSKIKDLFRKSKT